MLTTAFTLSAILLSASTVAAQSTTVDFNALTESSPGSGTRFVSNCYSESGYVFTAVGLPCSGPTSDNAFIAGGANSPLFGGGLTPSMLLNTPNASFIDITRLDGTTFALTSIGLAPFDGAMTTVSFTGTTFGGPVMQSFMLDALQVGFMTFDFGKMFAGLSSVRLTATNEFGEPLVKFDDLVVISSVAVVPEPSTVVLMLAGLAGLAFAASRRGRHA